VRKLRERREEGDVGSALERVRMAARSSENLLPPIIDAVKSLATLGEISDVLREEWGSYDEG
jgi:methylmalonyl-CoA mutase N-terminal domain/subunit